MIYFAGNGVRVEGEDSILPVDISPEPNDLASKSFSMAELADVTSNAKGTGIVVIDTCRQSCILSTAGSNIK